MKGALITRTFLDHDIASNECESNMTGKNITGDFLSPFFHRLGKKMLRSKGNLVVDAFGQLRDFGVPHSTLIGAGNYKNTKTVRASKAVRASIFLRRFLTFSALVCAGIVMWRRQVESVAQSVQPTTKPAFVQPRSVPPDGKVSSDKYEPHGTRLLIYRISHVMSIGR